jgi:hypothetical protein
VTELVTAAIFCTTFGMLRVGRPAMTHALPAVLVATLILPATAHAQTKPDFSGTWTMDPSRSESAMQNEPIGPVTHVIAQTPNELKIETRRGGRTTTAIYKLDGSESQLPDGTATTRWDGTTLVTEMVRDIKGATVTTKESRRLSADGNEMLVETVLVVQHGYSLRGTPNYGAGKDVFTRVRP